VPAAETGRRGKARVSLWLHSGRRRATDRVGGAGARARNRLTLRRRLTVPLCTVRIEHSCRLPVARRALSTSPARWPVYRTCLNRVRCVAAGMFMRKSACSPMSNGASTPRSSRPCQARCAPDIHEGKFEFPSRSGQPRTNTMRVKATVLAAVGAGLLAASVFLGITAAAEWAPCGAVHASAHRPRRHRRWQYPGHQDWHVLPDSGQLAAREGAGIMTAIDPRPTVITRPTSGWPWPGPRTRARSPGRVRRRRKLKIMRRITYTLAALAAAPALGFGVTACGGSPAGSHPARTRSQHGTGSPASRPVPHHRCSLRPVQRRAAQPVP
jgi:hypothetical protein